MIFADNNDMGGATLTVELPLVKLPKIIQVGADIQEQYVLVSNGHGGFASFSV